MLVGSGRSGLPRTFPRERSSSSTSCRPLCTIPISTARAYSTSWKGWSFSPDRVVLEITEKYAIENYALFGEAVRNFTEMGIAIAVDDIGAGHSGLEKIANLNPKFLKFDMELVRDIDASYVRQEMVKALKSFSDKMGSTIIAEGIERQEELDTLLVLGVDHGQGFLLGRPESGFGEKDPTLELRVAGKPKIRGLASKRASS